MPRNKQIFGEIAQNLLFWGANTDEMKSCPKCLLQYSDETLNFCLEDGTPLRAHSGEEAPTVSNSGRETDTFVRPRQTAAGPETNKHRASVLPMMAAALVSGIGVALIAGGIGAWIYLSGPDATEPAARIGDNSNADSNKPGPNPATPVPASTPLPGAPTPASTPLVGPTDQPPRTPQPPVMPPQFDRGQAVQAISASVYNWKSQAESRDLDSYMQNYAPTVHYYRKPGSSKAFVRSDKLRAFRTYSSMSIRITNMSVDVAGSGETATAFFDKEWVFSGSHRSSGKVRQQLKFQNSGGRWLITSERDLKVYYSN